MTQILHVKKKGQEVFRLAHDLTIYHVAETRADLDSHLSKHSSLVLDLSEVDEIDTSGVQLLLWLKREATAQGGGISLVGHSPAVVEAFDLLRVTGIFGDPILIGPA